MIKLYFFYMKDECFVTGLSSVFLD